ncbi:MAG: apolipoprotein N-acyltransferase [Microbacteriaceae bacterium]|nr:apolipoprotein N-acyltransferase [Microbacteriaceae bacterium]
MTARPETLPPATAPLPRGLFSRGPLAPLPLAPLPLWLALLVAAAAGPVLAAGFPSLSWWPLAFVGVGMILVTLRGRRAGTAALVGFVASLSFYLVLVHWTSLYLGPLPWIALATLESLFFAVGAMVITLAYRWIPRVWPSVLGRVGLLPVVVAGLWTAREAFVSVWPYGGFAWGRLAQSQSDSPFAPLVAWLGFSGLGFVMVLVVAVILECMRETRIAVSTRAIVAIGTVALVLAIPTWPATTSGSTRIAAVQGNGPAGYFDVRQPGDVLNSQVSATLPIVNQKVDMVVWPEGAADVDPTSNPEAAKVLDYLSQAMHAPIITGTITQRGGKVYNTSLLWEAGKGAVNYYDKIHPVPFGEYVPDRAFWRPFAPALIDLIGRDYTPGTRGNVFDVNGVKAGISICFDIADDQEVTDMARGGAQVILAQTNNADFGTTDENVQQLAIARLRAIETGRSLVNISTVGTSQIIDPNGRTIASIPAYKPGAMVASVPLGTTTTPADVFSRGIEYLVSGLGLAALMIAGATVARQRKATRGRAARN